MNNLKGYSVSNDGDMKRLAITYDVINENGKVINSNKKINRLISDEDIIKAVEIVDNFANHLIYEQEK